MEHLPPLSKPYEPIFVPYIGYCDYDGLGFLATHFYEDLDHDLFLRGNFQNSPADSIVTFLPPKKTATLQAGTRDIGCVAQYRGLCPH
jgi:hypothetical protein